jgi:hypothetical protein
LTRRLIFTHIDDLAVLIECPVPAATSHRSRDRMRSKHLADVLEVMVGDADTRRSVKFRA